MKQKGCVVLTAANDEFASVIRFRCVSNMVRASSVFVMYYAVFCEVGISLIYSRYILFNETGWIRSEPKLFGGKLLCDYSLM
jgi:hypothetical protein